MILLFLYYRYIGISVHRIRMFKSLSSCPCGCFCKMTDSLTHCGVLLNNLRGGKKSVSGTPRPTASVLVDSVFYTRLHPLYHFVPVYKWSIPGYTILPPARQREICLDSQGGPCPIHPPFLHVFMTNPLVIVNLAFVKLLAIICSLAHGMRESMADRPHTPFPPLWG